MKAVRFSWNNLERQDWHLWLLAMLFILILGISLLSLMFPVVYWGGELHSNPVNQRIAFYGFSTLLSLMLVYVLQRQADIRQLKRQVFEAKTETQEEETKGLVRGFLALPNRRHFRDALAMELRRASTMERPLVVAMFQVRNLPQEEMGQAATLFSSLLHYDETVARVSDHTLGIIFPETELVEATTIVQRVRDYVLARRQTAQIKTKIIPYPQDAETLAELEIPFRGIYEQERG
jgi:GGDEF domain-containing protein